VVAAAILLAGVPAAVDRYRLDGIGEMTVILSSALILAFLLQTAPAGRTGVVAGRIQTRDGAPAVAVRVAAIQAPPVGARPEDGLQYYEGPPPVSTVLSDEQGSFRLRNIPPGRYLIVAGMLGEATYYPSTIEWRGATVVTITAGGPPIENVDFRLVLPLGGRVRGRVTPAPDPGLRTLAVLSGLRLTEILEMPVAADGSFEIGHVPKGSYLLNLYPMPAGMASLVFQVGDADLEEVQFKPPQVHTVSGRIVVENGPLPIGLLAFTTPTSHVSATINPDGTFTARLHAGRHQADLAGLPVGYAMASVRRGSQDVASGIVVGNSDIPDLVITVAAPRALPRLRGRVTGIPAGTAAKIELTGPIAGRLEATAGAGGSFEFPVIIPGLYSLRLPEFPQLAPLNVVVDSQGNDIQVAVPGR
jgi:hypothetical protein